MVLRSGALGLESTTYSLCFAGRLARMQLVVVLAGGQRVVDDLLQARADQHVADLLLGVQGLVAMLGRQHGVEQALGHMFVADDTRHLFDQVGRHGDVQPVPGRSALVEIFAVLALQAEGGIVAGLGVDRLDHAHAEIKPLQALDDLLAGDGHAQDAALIGDRGVGDTRRLFDRIGVDHARHDAAAGVEAHQLGGAAGGDGVERGRDAAAEADSWLRWAGAAWPPCAGC